MELGRVKQGKSHQKDRHYPYSGRARQQSEDTVPGVQKIKSSLRQAKRLLTKENLAANVRVETERKLKALEADLLKAQNARQERAMAVKYHKVKFFGTYIFLFSFSVFPVHISSIKNDKRWYGKSSRQKGAYKAQKIPRSWSQLCSTSEWT